MRFEALHSDNKSGLVFELGSELCRQKRAALCCHNWYALTDEVAQVADHAWSRYVLQRVIAILKTGMLSGTSTVLEEKGDSVFRTDLILLMKGLNWAPMQHFRCHWPNWLSCQNWYAFADEELTLGLQHFRSNVPQLALLSKLICFDRWVRAGGWRCSRYLLAPSCRTSAGHTEEACATQRASWLEDSSIQRWGGIYTLVTARTIEWFQPKCSSDEDILCLANWVKICCVSQLAIMPFIWQLWTPHNRQISYSAFWVETEGHNRKGR